MGRAPCCSKVGLRRGPWSTKEDTILTNYIQQHGDGQWRSLPKKAGLLRCGKSCRLRWMNYLRPGIKRGDINQDEEDLIVRLHGLLGNRWSLIAGRLPGRTDNEIKNYWNTHLVKKLKIQLKDLQKPVKTKKMKNKKQNQKQKKVEKNDDNVKLITGTSMAANDENLNDHQKIKVYVPKPIRVSSGFSRTHSCESLGSASTASNGAAERVADLPVDWAELFEMEDIYGGAGAGDGDDIFGCGFITPLFRHSQFLDSMCSDVNMLDKLYDEYLQLL